MDKAYMWDLTTLYKDDNAWREALGGVDEKITAVSAFQGKLTDADHVLAYFKADTDLSLLLSDLFCYASLRRSEDTRAADAQAMYAQIYGKYVQAVSATAFAEPEILALPEETLKSLTDDPKLKDYRYLLVRSSPRRSRSRRTCRTPICSSIRRRTRTARSTRSRARATSRCR